MNNEEVSMSTKELLQAYKIITRIMKENEFMHDTSFRRVQTWLSNAVCDSMEEGQVINI